MKKFKDIFPSKIMNPICQQAGCDDQTASKHAWKWEMKRFHYHPSMAFTAWWEPYEFDQLSGAHKGGHPEARRKWARKDHDGWKHGWCGTPILDAWNTASYLEEFEAWQKVGSPEPITPFVSIAATLDQQKGLWKRVKPILAGIGKAA